MAVPAGRRPFGSDGRGACCDWTGFTRRCWYDARSFDEALGVVPPRLVRGLEGAGDELAACNERFGAVGVWYALELELELLMLFALAVNDRLGAFGVRLLFVVRIGCRLGVGVTEAGTRDAGGVRPNDLRTGIADVGAVVEADAGARAFCFGARTVRRAGDGMPDGAPDERRGRGAAAAGEDIGARWLTGDGAAECDGRGRRDEADETSDRRLRCRGRRVGVWYCAEDREGAGEGSWVDGMSGGRWAGRVAGAVMLGGRDVGGGVGGARVDGEREVVGGRG